LQSLYLIGICSAGRILLDNIKLESPEEVQDPEVQESEKLEPYPVPTEVLPHLIQIKAGSKEVRFPYYRSIFRHQVKISVRFNSG
jgi:hypothetical protein